MVEKPQRLVTFGMPTAHNQPEDSNDFSQNYGFSTCDGKQAQTRESSPEPKYSTGSTLKEALHNIGKYTSSFKTHFGYFRQ